MPNFYDRLRGVFGVRQPAKPFQEQGSPGFAVYGGYINQVEQNPEMWGQNRWRTASDLLANISVIAASVRFTLNLISRPTWKFDPPDDTPQAKAMAEFAEEIFDDIDESWTRVVRRAGMYRYHGFGIHEWIAKKRDDGKIGIEAVESRPQHTINRWDIDEQSQLIGVWQRNPQDGQELYIPRKKQLYLVDDSLTDSPDGMGWFRHLAEPAKRLKSYLELEGIGYERDLGGIPIARAPLQRLNELMESGKLTSAQVTQAMNQLNDFIKLKRKSSETGLVLDSTPYLSKTDTGTTVSSIYEWGMELITGEQHSLQELSVAIKRLEFDMALIMGTESMLIGREGAGSHALSQDKSKNLYLTANSTLEDMAECVDRDILTPIWEMNGLDMKLKPHCQTEDVSFQDVEQIGKVLADMATAGAILDPNDPAINDLRDLMGISRAVPMDIKTLNALQGRPDPTKPPPVPPAGGRPPGAPPPNKAPDAPPKAGQPDKPPNPVSKFANASYTDTLYVSRRLLNADQLIAWAKGAGFAVTVPANEMHVTIAHSQKPVDWTSIPESLSDTVRAYGGMRQLAALGDGSAIVLMFESQDLRDDWAQIEAAGAEWGWPEYIPHVTITYQGTNLDLSTIKPFQGPLLFGPEIFEPISTDDWSESFVEKRILAAVAKYSDSEPRDERGRWTGGGAGAGGSTAPAAAHGILYEVAPNPDNKELTARWDSLSDAEKQSISDKISQQVTPQILEAVGVKGATVQTMGGFEGHMNPSYMVTVDGKAFETAGAIGQIYGQKAMVIYGSSAAPGLEAHGMIAVHAPGAGPEELRSIESALGPHAADGWTYHNGQFQVLNFTGRSDTSVAQEIDKRLGGKYEVIHDTVHSAYIGANDYVSPKSAAGGNPWGQVSSRLSQTVSTALESSLTAVGKADGQTGTAGQVEKYSDDQPRDEHGRWTSGGGGSVGNGYPAAMTPEIQKQLIDGQRGKTIEELHAMAIDNQQLLKDTGEKIAANIPGVKFALPPGADNGVKDLAGAKDKLLRKPNYDGPAYLTDLSRASFVVDTPEAAHAAVKDLASAFPGKVFDEGWKTEPSSLYRDRKALIQMPNGGVSEIQFVSKGMYKAKFADGGWQLYDLARNPKTPRGQAQLFTQVMQAKYSSADAGTEFARMNQ